MHTIHIKDKKFRILISESEILRQVRRVAEAINRDYQDQEPVFLVVLNGAFVFAADLFREISLPSEISFVKLSSYQGVSTTGKVRELIGLQTSITGRPVVVVEDIVDTGITMAHLLETLREQNPSALEVCTLLMKPDSLQVDLNIKYWCMKIPNDFIVGYGLDYDEKGRNLRDIYVLAE